MSDQTIPLPIGPSGAVTVQRPMIMSGDFSEMLESASKVYGGEMEEALRHIGPHHRHAIVETYYRDRPCAEVAAEAGVPVGTMRSRLYYGLKALRLVLEEREWTG